MSKLKKLTQKEFDKIVKQHKAWLDNTKTGKKARFENVDFGNVVLDSVDLRYAEFDDVSFRYCSITDVKFDKATFENVDFHSASINNCSFANVDLDDDSNFSCANLLNVSFASADCRYADFSDTSLTDVNFEGADCEGTDFRSAEFCNCNFTNMKADERTAGYWLACPESGAFIAYKRAHLYNKVSCIVKLAVPASALRSSATTRKCRVSKAKVISITYLDGERAKYNAYSDHNESFVYKVGKTVEVKNFDKNRWHECAPGIHCFINRQEAVQYC